MWPLEARGLVGTRPFVPTPWPLDHPFAHRHSSRLRRAYPAQGVLHGVVALLLTVLVIDFSLLFVHSRKPGAAA